MKKIKICFISTSAYPLFNSKCKDQHGGTELQLYLIAKELAKSENFEVSFILGDFRQKNIEVINQIRLYKSFIPKSEETLIKKLIQAIKYFNLFKKINTDIYITSAANSTVGLVSLFCKFNKKIHIHRTASQMDINKSFIKLNGILGKIYQYGLENADIVITQNNEHKKLLKRNHNIDAIVIKNFFEIKRIKKRIPKNSILWVSRYLEMKRPKIFLELAKKFPNENFIIICSTKEKNNKYKQLILNAKKIKNLKFIEKVPFNEIQKYFNKAKVFVNTSDYEGFPNTFIQAGLGKTPILSLNVNPDNFITKYNCGYFCKGNFDVMVEKLDKLFTDKKDWEEKSNNCYKYVKKNHDINKNIKKFKKIIFNLDEEK